MLKKLNINDVITAILTALSSLQGGMIMAINMPYKATDRPDMILSGRILPARIPHRVPKPHSVVAGSIAPKVYSGIIFLLLATVIAKISSVI